MKTKTFGLKVVNELPEAIAFKKDMAGEVAKREAIKDQLDAAKTLAVSGDGQVRKWNDPILQGETPELMHRREVERLSAELATQDKIISKGHTAWGGGEWSPVRPILGSLSDKVCKDPENVAKLLGVVERMVVTLKVTVHGSMTSGGAALPLRLASTAAVSH
jgi:hypothetical protein